MTSSSDEKLCAAVDLGANSGVRHDHPEWVARARTLTADGAGFDVVLDSVGRWEESVAALRPGGRLVVLGASTAETARLAIRPFYFGQFDLLGTTMGSAADLSALLAFLRDHHLAPPPIDRTYPLDAAAQAHERLEAGAGFGKIVLETGQ